MKDKDDFLDFHQIFLLSFYSMLFFIIFIGMYYISYRNNDGEMPSAFFILFSLIPLGISAFLLKSGISKNHKIAEYLDTGNLAINIFTFFLPMPFSYIIWKLFKH
jgi:hypothetical protein